VPECNIASIEAKAFELALTEPFGISGGTAEVARIALYRVTLSDGAIGLGEAAPLPAYNGETVAHALAAVPAARSHWIGKSALDWRERALELRGPLAACGSARCALETALCDALARRARVSLHSWFGGCQPLWLESDVTIPIVEPSIARDSAERWWGEGFRCLKIKIGSGDDFGRILATHSGAPAAKLLLDANGAFDADGAIELLERLHQAGVAVELFEQPVARGDWLGLERVAKRVRVALDESVVSARDAAEAARRLGPPHVLNIKLMKSGIVEALDIAAVARAAGMSLMIGGMLESELAMSASACFATGQGAFEFADLDTPLFLRSSPCIGGFARRGAQIDVSAIDLGHGVEIAAGALF
jgi:L-alanine-DL-glutamate epimerase-like enolase superfamily enzyme